MTIDRWQFGNDIYIECDSKYTEQHMQELANFTMSYHNKEILAQKGSFFRMVHLKVDANSK